MVFMGRLSMELVPMTKGRVRIDQGRFTPNTTTNYGAYAISQWLAGVNNTGYQPVLPPFYVELGTGTGTTQVTDTGLFTPVLVTLTTCATAIPAVGPPPTITIVCNFVGTAITAGTYTEAILTDLSGNVFAHTLKAITITTGLTTTLQWVLTDTPQ